MKLMSGLFVVCLAIEAMASQVPNPILRFTLKGSPQLGSDEKISERCDIFATKVHLQKSESVPAITYPALFTKEVTSAAAAERLVRQAKKGKLMAVAGTTDGPSATYTGVLTVGVGTPDYVLLAQNGPSGIVNSEKASVDPLVALTDLNCRPQKEVLAFFGSPEFEEAYNEQVHTVQKPYVLAVSHYEVVKKDGKIFVVAKLVKTWPKSTGGKELGSLVGEIVYEKDEPVVVDVEFKKL